LRYFPLFYYYAHSFSDQMGGIIRLKKKYVLYSILSCTPLNAHLELNHIKYTYTPIALLQLRVAQTYGQALYTHKSTSAHHRIKPYGYTRLSLYPDSRQVIRTRPGGIFLFPAPYCPDITCKDINAHPQFSMQAAGTKIGLLFGPESPFNNSEHKMYGLIEADFRGITEPTYNLLRLKHAFGEIVWQDGSFLFGQYFHPLYILRSFANTVDFNMGAPFEPQAVSPQLRLTQLYNTWEFRAALASQSYYVSPGPCGPSNVYMRNAAVPNMHIQVRKYGGDNYAGIALDYKRLVPRLVTNNNFKAHEHINSAIIEAYGHVTHDCFTCNGKLIFAQNGSDQLLISGYAVKTRDSLTDHRTYVNTRALAAWLDTYTIFHDKQMLIGLFLGYTKNIGSAHALYINPATEQPIIYALADIAQNLDYNMRISPRCVYSNNTFRSGIELSFTRASFGTPNQFARVIASRPATDIRFIASFDYIF
jgi:hypothetical protein